MNSAIFVSGFKGILFTSWGNRRPQISFTGSLEDGSVRRGLSWGGSDYLCCFNNRFAALPGLAPVESLSEILSMELLQQIGITGIGFKALYRRGQDHADMTIDK